MSVLTDIVGGIVGVVGKAAIDIRTAITGVSPDKQAELTALAANLEAQKQKAETDLMNAQIELNKQEAANTNLFVAGWRPFVGWTCGGALAFNFLLRPLATWILIVVGHPLELPILDWQELSPILLGLLGLGTMRTVEKINNAQGNH